MNTPGSDAAAEQQNNNLVDRLRRSELFRSYEKVFSEATSLPLALQPLEYWQLLHHGKKNENPFCALLAQQPATLAACLEAHDEMIRHSGELPHTVTCPFGLTETSVPVRLGAQQSDHVGKTKCRAANCAEGARVYREKQNRIDFAGWGVKSRRCERLSF